jgi:hypothetical protein
MRAYYEAGEYCTAELHNLYSSPSISRVIKSRTVGWEGYTVRIGKMRNSFKILVGNPERKRAHGGQSSRWQDSNKCILMEQDMRVWTVFIWLSTKTSDEFTPFGAEDGDSMLLRNVGIYLSPRGITTQKTNIDIS